MKMELLKECESLKNNTINGEKLSIRFYGKDENTEPASASFLPVYIHSCPSNFSTVNYFEVSMLIQFFQNFKSGKYEIKKWHNVHYIVHILTSFLETYLNVLTWIIYCRLANSETLF